MAVIKTMRIAAVALLPLAIIAPNGAFAQEAYASVDSDAMHAGQLDVPLNKSQVVRADRPYAKALIGNQEIADVLPMSGTSLYVLGKKMGTTSLTLYDRGNNLISVIDVAVGPDVVGLRRQLSELMPKEKISVRMSNESVILSGIVSSGPAAERARAIAATYAADKVVNMLSVGASQQVMLEVRFSEMSRSVGKSLGLNTAFTSRGGTFQGGIGEGALGTTVLTGSNGAPTIDLGGILKTYGVAATKFHFGRLNIASALDALEEKGLVKTLAEPNLLALSGEPATFLAGGEFPIPVGQDSTAGARNITIEFKQFGVSLAFTPTVLDDGVISLVVAPEVSSIDPTASITLNGLVIPGLKTRRAKTTLELRDGQAFAIAGLIKSDFRDTVHQIPFLGSVPILGALFRSTGFQKEETELVIIVTPRLVQPMHPEDVRLPTDRAGTPSETDLFLNGRTDNAVGILPGQTPKQAPPTQPTPKAPATGGQATPATGFEGPTGHEL